MIKDRDLFTFLDETYSGHYECANKSSSKIEGIGTVEFFAQLQDALFTPENGQNWLSSAKPKQSGANMHFADTDEFVTKNGTRFELEPSKNRFIWRMVTNLYLEYNKVNMSDKHCFATSLQWWNEKLGHTNFLEVKRLRHHVDGMFVEGKAVEVCATCEKSKAKLRAVPEDVTTKPTEIMKIVHSDVLGPIAEEPMDEHKYTTGFQIASRALSVCTL